MSSVNIHLKKSQSFLPSSASCDHVVKLNTGCVAQHRLLLFFYSYAAVIVDSLTTSIACMLNRKFLK